MTILVLSPRLSDSRRAAFRALTRELGEPRFLGPDEAPLDVGAGDAIVVDGPQPARPLGFLAAIRAAVERGAALVAIGAAPAERDGFWADLLGVVAAPAPPPGEYYARITEAHSHLSARVTREFAVARRLRAPRPARARQGHRRRERGAQGLGRRRGDAARRGASGRLRPREYGRRAPHARARPAPRSRALRPDLTCCGRNIGVGIVGYGPLGGMGYHHGLGATRTDGIELVAVVDPSLERRKAAETDFPGVRTYAALGELVEDDDVEIAFVATPPAHHAPLTLELLARRQARRLREAALPHRGRGRPDHRDGDGDGAHADGAPEPPLGSRLRGDQARRLRRAPRRDLQRRDLRGRLRPSVPHLALGRRRLRRRRLRLGLAPRRLGAPAHGRPAPASSRRTGTSASGTTSATSTRSASA